MAYATLALLKAYLSVSGAGDDTLLEAKIVRAQAIIDEEMGFAFEASLDTTRYFDPTKMTKKDDALTLYFDTWLAALADTDPVNNKADGTPVAITSTHYYLLPVNEGPPYFGIRLLSSKGTVWEYEDDPDKGVSVKGKWAWSIAAPDNIVHATIRLAAFLYRQKDASADLDRPLLTANGVVILPSTMPNDVMSILDDYRSLTAWPGSED